MGTAGSSQICTAVQRLIVPTFPTNCVPSSALLVPVVAQQQLPPKGCLLAEDDSREPRSRGIGLLWFMHELIGMCDCTLQRHGELTQRHG